MLEVRRDSETYGKEKIAAILRRDKNQTISDSTVGRILGYLRAKGLITRSRSAPQKRKRNFSKGHAKGWNYKDYKDIEMGERVQIDHMTATKNGVTFKYFQAWERRSKHIHAQVYSNATARSAKRFLQELVEIAPYKIISIQVDGGSEFMADFETACEQWRSGSLCCRQQDRNTTVVSSAATAPSAKSSMRVVISLPTA